MDLIDRYVYAVMQYLPESIREDVGKELRSNIEDMLPEQPTKQDIYQVLEKLGSPRLLADEYNPQKRYLIGPGYYERYVSVLKMVVGICVIAFASIAIVVWAVEAKSDLQTTDHIAKLISNVISSGFEGALQAALWVTLIFFIIERSGVEEGSLPFSKKAWSPDSLPAIIQQTNQDKISRGETIVSMFCTIIFTAIFYLHPQLISIYIKQSDGSMLATPLFQVERLQTYMPFILSLALIQLGVGIFKYVKGRWNLSVAICNAIHNLVLSIFLIVILNDKSIFHEKFFTVVAELLKISRDTVVTSFDRGIWVFAAIFILINAWDSIRGFVKYNRCVGNMISKVDLLSKQLGANRTQK